MISLIDEIMANFHKKSAYKKVDKNQAYNLLIALKEYSSKNYA